MKTGLKTTVIGKNHIKKMEISDFILSLYLTLKIFLYI